MATTSYSTLFGTTGAGKQGSRAGIGTLFGQQAAPEDETEQQKQQRLQPTQTFAQLQKQGMARPAPQAPQGQPFARFEGSQQAQQARTGMLGALQQQLQQPTRFDTQAFQQIRQAQQANIQSQFEEQQRQLNEDLARRGLSASNIAASGLGRLGGAQARAMADIDAQLLQQAAQTQAADRLAALQAAQGFAELAGSQDLAQFEANRVAQAAEFQQGLQGAQFGQQQREFESGQALAAAQAQQAGQESAMERGLREALGLGEIIRGERQQELQAAELTGSLGEQQTLSARQQAEQQRQFNIQQDLQRQLGLGGLGIQERELGLRAQQLQQEAQLQGRSLTIEEARLAAQQEQFGQQLGFNREELALRGELGRNEQQIAENRLAQEGRLQEAQQAIQLKELGQRQQQFESTLNVEEQRFVRTLKEQQDARLQQLGVSTRELDLRADQIEKDYERSGQTIGLTKARDEAEIEYRKDALKQEAALRGDELDERVADREARDAFQRDQLAVEDRLRTQGIAVDRERLASAERQASGRVQIGTEIVYNDAGVPIGERPIFGQTVEAQQLEQQRRMQEAELTGKIRINGVDVDTLAAQQLGQQRAAQLADQAARQSQLTGVMYTVDKNGKIVQEFTQDAQGNRVPVSTEARRAQMQQEEQARLDRQLRETLGMGELTGTVTRDGQVVTTLPAQTARQNLLVQLAGALAGSEKGIPANFLQQLYATLGIYNPPGGEDNTDERRDRETERKRGATSGTPSGGTGTGTGTGGRGTGTR
jgi:hypothetical protein